MYCCTFIVILYITIEKTWNYFWSQLLLWSEFCSNSWRIECSSIWSEFWSHCVVRFLEQLTSAIRWLQLFFWSEFCYRSERIRCSPAFSDWQGKMRRALLEVSVQKTSQRNSEFFKNVSRILTRKTSEF